MMKYNKYYNGHNFIKCDKQRSFSYEDFQCMICNSKIQADYDNNMMFYNYINDFAKYSDLTCEEIVIKNLLE